MAMRHCSNEMMPDVRKKSATRTLRLQASMMTSTNVCLVSDTTSHSCPCNSMQCCCIIPKNTHKVTHHASPWAIQYDCPAPHSKHQNPPCSSKAERNVRISTASGPHQLISLFLRGLALTQKLLARPRPQCPHYPMLRATTPAVAAPPLGHRPRLRAAPAQDPRLTPLCKVQWRLNKCALMEREKESRTLESELLLRAPQAQPYQSNDTHTITLGVRHMRHTCPACRSPAICCPSATGRPPVSTVGLPAPLSPR